jgi:hypothetical protein
MAVLGELQPWRWRQYVSPKRQYLPTSLHGVTTQNNIAIFTAVKTSNNNNYVTWVHSNFKEDKISSFSGLARNGRKQHAALFKVIRL